VKPDSKKLEFQYPFHVYFVVFAVRRHMSRVMRSFFSLTEDKPQLGNQVFARRMLRFDIESCRSEVIAVE
jgi:hypothetical protein